MAFPKKRPTKNHRRPNSVRPKHARENRFIDSRWRVRKNGLDAPPYGKVVDGYSTICGAPMVYIRDTARSNRWDASDEHTES